MVHQRKGTDTAFSEDQKGSNICIPALNAYQAFDILFFEILVGIKNCRQGRVLTTMGDCLVGSRSCISGLTERLLQHTTSKWTYVVCFIATIPSVCQPHLIVSACSRCQGFDFLYAKAEGKYLMNRLCHFQGSPSVKKSPHYICR